MPPPCPAPYINARKVFASLLMLFISLSSAWTQALPEDRDQPMRITADKAERDDVSGVTIYTGSVILIQGTLKLTSEKLTIYQTDGEPSKIIAEGKPAKMQERPKPEKAMMYAEGQVITYYKAEERVHLQTDGYVEQGGQEVKGDSIDYFIEKELTKAKSGKDSRVEVVIPPSELKSKDDSGTTKSE